MIENSGKIICLAGIIGGLESAGNLETKNVFLESAYFNSEVISKAGLKTIRM